MPRRRPQALGDGARRTDRRTHPGREPRKGRVHTDLLVLAPGYGERIPNLVAARHLASVARLLGRSPAVRAGLARSRLAHLRAIDREVAGLEVRLASLVAASRSSLADLPGVGVLVAAKLLGGTGDVRHLRSPAAFASITDYGPPWSVCGQRRMKSAPKHNGARPFTRWYSAELRDIGP